MSKQPPGVVTLKMVSRVLDEVGAWKLSAGALEALASFLGLEPPLPSPDEIVAVALDGLMVLREAYEADQAEDLERLRAAFAKAGKALERMNLPPADVVGG